MSGRPTKGGVGFYLGAGTGAGVGALKCSGMAGIFTIFITAPDGYTLCVVFIDLDAARTVGSGTQTNGWSAVDVGHRKATAGCCGVTFVIITGDGEGETARRGSFGVVGRPAQEPGRIIPARAYDGSSVEAASGICGRVWIVDDERLGERLPFGCFERLLEAYDGGGLVAIEDGDGDGVTDVVER